MRGWLDYFATLFNCGSPHGDDLNISPHCSIAVTNVGIAWLFCHIVELWFHMWGWLDYFATLFSRGSTCGDDLIILPHCSIVVPHAWMTWLFCHIVQSRFHMRRWLDYSATLFNRSSTCGDDLIISPNCPTAVLRVLLDLSFEKNIQPSFAFPPVYCDFSRLPVAASLDFVSWIFPTTFTMFQQPWQGHF